MATNSTEQRQADTKVLIGPVDHFTGPRRTRRTFRAYLSPRAANDYSCGCSHESGHRTIDAAVECGKAMWRRLPA